MLLLLCEKFVGSLWNLSSLPDECGDEDRVNDFEVTFE